MNNNLKTNENFKIRFQLFGNEGGGEPAPGTDPTPAPGGEPKTYTAEEVAQLLQREGDRRVTEALKKAEKNTAQKIKEAERLAGLSEAERNAERIRTLEAEVEQKNRELATRENTITLQGEMAKRNIPVEFTKFLVSDDADTMFENLKTFDEGIRKLVNAEVEKRISSNTPKTGNTDPTALTKESFSKMSLSEQQALYSRDPALFKSLMNG